MKKLLLLIIALMLSFTAAAALYNITGTDDFVNGIPSSLTAKERAKLTTTTVAKTQASCLAGKCKLVDTIAAKAKIKAILVAESMPVCSPPSVLNTTTNKCETPPPPPVCPQYTTGTYPACVPIPCGQGFTGNQPNCTPIPVLPVSLMPTVDLSKEIKPAIGYDTIRIKPTTEQPVPDTIGAFRVVCDPSHMSNDDPLLYPNQKSATHHHTFYGNTKIQYDTDLSKIDDVGNSTCKGGIMNRSAYWHPTMIDATNGAPVIPDDKAIFYYKTGYAGVPAELVVPPPKGLRMIAGNAKATNASESQATIYKCTSNGAVQTKAIPNCAVGDSVTMVVTFPQCWDGVNLDSPNHKDHMARPSKSYTTANKCPSSHPVAIPEISLNLIFKVKTANQSLNWRLASDNYVWDGKNAGYSGHSDYVEGWDRPTIEGIVKNCLNKKLDCHAHLLGDGRMFY